MRIKCADCADFDLCLQCFATGVEIFPHKVGLGVVVVVGRLCLSVFPLLCMLAPPLGQVVAAALCCLAFLNDVAKPKITHINTSLTPLHHNAHTQHKKRRSTATASSTCSPSRSTTPTGG